MILDLFYLIGLLPLALEIKGLLSPKKMIALAGRMNDELERSADAKEVPVLDKDASQHLFWELGYIAWIAIGIIIGVYMGTYWGLFISIIVFSMIPKKKLWWVIIDSIISTLTISAILFLHFFYEGS